MKLGKVKVRLTPGGERVSFPVHLAETPQEGIDMLGGGKGTSGFKPQPKERQTEKNTSFIGQYTQKVPAREKQNLVCVGKNNKGDSDMKAHYIVQAYIPCEVEEEEVFTTFREAQDVADSLSEMQPENMYIVEEAGI